MVIYRDINNIIVKKDNLTLINNQTVNALRFLSADAVEKANSGHPGMPLGMADIAEVLWRDHLNHNPKKSSMV